MTPKRDDTLSDLARELLAAERSVVEGAPLKERAVARARAAVEASRSSKVGGLHRAWGKVLSLPRVAVPAAALAIAGLAAAGAAMLTEPSASEPPRPALVSTSGPTPDGKRAGEREEAVAAPPPAQPTTVVPAPVPSTTGGPRAAAQAKRSDAASRAGSARQYALELEVLEPARQAIARGNYGAALEAAARHEQSFPSGQLAEERSALKVRALWASGRREEARAAAAAFGRRYPRSGLLSWMRE